MSSACPANEEATSSSQTFSITVNLASGTGRQIEELCPATCLSALVEKVAGEMGFSANRVTLALGSQVFGGEHLGKSLAELGIGEASVLSCILVSMWKNVEELGIGEDSDLLQLDLPGDRKLHIGGVDAKTGMIVLLGYEECLNLSIFVIPPESTGQPVFELASDPCPTWLTDLTGGNGACNQPLSISSGHCFVSVSQSDPHSCAGALAGSLIHFRLEPGPLSYTVLDAEQVGTATALGIDEHTESVLVATAEGEIHSRKFASLGEGQVLFKSEVKDISSLVCTGSHMFLASAQHSVHIYAACGEGWVHSFVIGDGQKGPRDSIPPRVNAPALFPSPAPDGAFLLSDSDLFTVGTAGKLTWQSKVRDEDFLCEGDTGSPGPIARSVIGLHQQRIFRIIEQSYLDPNPLRCRMFGS